MAGKYGSASVAFFVDGYNLISNKVKSLRYKEEAMQEDTTGLGDSFEEHSPTGVSKVELAQDGAFFDTTADYIHTAMAGSVPSTPQDTERVACIAFAGATIGEMFVGFQGAWTTSYEVLGTIGELTKANALYLITGQVDKGTILQPLATKTADWDTNATSVDYTADTSQRVVPITSSSVANPTVITTTVPHGLTTGDTVLIAGHAGSTPDINGEEAVTVTSTTTFTVVQNVSVGGTGGTIVRGKTNNGGVGYLQVGAYSGFTNFVCTIEDSADDAAWASLVAFTDVTSGTVAAERVTVAGACDRYLSIDGNITGTGTLDVFVGFSRS